MIVVSDTSAISNLFQIDLLDLLQQLYGGVIITPAVQRELYAIPSQRKIAEAFSWIDVINPSNQQLVAELLVKLDLGEAESIALALEKRADYLIIDEFLGRRIADEYGIKIVGVLGILIQAKQKGLVKNVKPYIEKLRDNGFRLNPGLVDKVLRQLGER